MAASRCPVYGRAASVCAQQGPWRCQRHADPRLLSLRPNKEGVASAQAPVLNLQCALGARQPERVCTRCVRKLGGKGQFTECWQLKVKEEAWLRRGACLNC
jgi:hypothetical protein